MSCEWLQNYGSHGWHKITRRRWRNWLRLEEVWVCWACDVESARGPDDRAFWERP